MVNFFFAGGELAKSYFCGGVRMSRWPRAEEVVGTTCVLSLAADQFIIFDSGKFYLNYFFSSNVQRIPIKDFLVFVILGDFNATRTNENGP